MTTFISKGQTAKNDPFYRTGKKLRTVQSAFTITTAGAADGDIYVLAGGLTTESRIHRIMSPNATPAITSADDCDFGFYYSKEGVMTVIDADALVDGMDLSSALSTRDLLSGNATLDRTLTIGEATSLAPDDTYAGGIFLCLTINTKSTATTVELDLDIVIEEPTDN